MFIVTNEAAAAIKSMLDEADGWPESHTFRLGFDESGRPGLVWDEPTNEDHRIQVDNETILLIDEDAWNRLDNLIMHVVETAEGPRLKMIMILRGKLFAESPIYRGECTKDTFHARWRRNPSIGLLGRGSSRDSPVLNGRLNWSIA